MRSDRGILRDALLAGLIVALLAGCGLLGKTKTEYVAVEPPTADMRPLATAGAVLAEATSRPADKDVAESVTAFSGEEPADPLPSSDAEKAALAEALRSERKATQRALEVHQQDFEQQNRGAGGGWSVAGVNLDLIQLLVAGGALAVVLSFLPQVPKGAKPHVQALGVLSIVFAVTLYFSRAVLWAVGIAGGLWVLFLLGRAAWTWWASKRIVKSVQPLIDELTEKELELVGVKQGSAKNLVRALKGK